MYGKKNWQLEVSKNIKSVAEAYIYIQLYMYIYIYTVYCMLPLY